ncbi:extracellular solute-binding protein [Actinotalea sp. M2MS4P-6]|uniref:ABC transporter substrate-binding protein n=1 Tax=Actinotalea sp. M2MS4P-6 TaxID=2983762 RepID=UPI0021E4B25D|nr:extracellular solute-binding protein [Actinotalea sp. M2MS4P-6]MCV2394434.1 extracellular solute-binding protein [Actinotalea sp. M2MS4P-6]
MRSTVLSRRRLGVAALAVASTLVMAACGTATGNTDAGGSGTPTLSTEDVDLRVAWWGGDSRVPITQDAIKAFEAEYPNIHVTGEYSDWGGYWDKLATETAGNNAPDVFQMDELYLASYAQRGTLVDLSQYPQLDTSALDPNVVALGQTDNGLYGMPISTTGFAILVNQDVLDELGLTLPDTTTWTWDDLQAFAESVTEASGGSIVGIGPMNNGYSLRLWARQNGEELFTDNAVSISADTLAGYFQMALDWTKSGAAASASQQAQSASGSIDQSDFSTQKQALAFSQSTQVPVYEASTGANIQLVQIPSMDANKTPWAYVKPGMYWSVSSQSAHPAEAAAFVNFMVNSVEAGKILGTDRGIPANPDVRSAIADTLSSGQTKAVDFDAIFSQNLGTAPNITPNGASQLDSVIARYLQDVEFEKETPADAATAMIDELQQSIDEAN